MFCNGCLSCLYCSHLETLVLEQQQINISLYSTVEFWYSNMSKKNFNNFDIWSGYFSSLMTVSRVIWYAASQKMHHTRFFPFIDSCVFKMIYLFISKYFQLKVHKNNYKLKASCCCPAVQQYLQYKISLFHFAGFIHQWN